jgi:hypothetical protein
MEKCLAESDVIKRKRRALLASCLNDPQSKNGVEYHPYEHRPPVAVRLAGDGALKIAVAGKPDCYGFGGAPKPPEGA